MPALALGLRVRYGSRLRLAAFYASAVALAIGLAAIFVALDSSVDRAVGSTAGYVNLLRQVVGDSLLEGLANIAAFSLGGLWKYFLPSDSGLGLLATMPLLPVIGGAFLLRSWLAFKGNQSDRLLLAVLVAFAPFAALAGQLGMRPSQNLPMVAALYMLLGATIDWLVGQLRRHRSAWVPTATAIVVTCGLAVYQAAEARFGLERALDRNLLVHLLRGEAFTSELRGRATAEWLAPRLAPGEPVLVSNVAFQHGAAWALGTGHRALTMPYHQVARGVAWPYYAHAVPGLDYHLVDVWRGASGQPDVPFFLFSWANLREMCGAHGVRYVALSEFAIDATTVLALEKSVPDAKLTTVEDRGITVSIWSCPAILARQPNGASKPLIGDNAVSYMTWLRQARPSSFIWYRRELFSAILGIPEPSLSGLFDGHASDHYSVVP